jgi:tRNA-(ms[2]io[6]A)-hydroxylase
MLCLQAPTNPEWLTIAANNIIPLMVDHAHCEKKAAANAMNLIMRYSDHEELVKEMITVMEEELAHFKLMVNELCQRGATLGKDPGNWYAQQLSQCIRKAEPERLLDSLLVDAFIEARSCERFTLLAGSEAIPEDVRGIYYSLMASEEGHYESFIALARQYFPNALVEQRLQEIASHEATIVRSLTNTPTMHG